MPTTAKGLRYPASSAAPNTPQDIQNLAADVNSALPGTWVDAYASTTSYSYGPGAANTWETMTGFNVNTGTIPAGRTLDVEFRAPICNAGDGFVYVRLLINNNEVDTAGFSATWSQVRLSGSIIPASSGFQNIVVQAQRTGTNGDVRAISGAPLRLRYRIV